jgi:hypothetical protein
VDGPQAGRVVPRARRGDRPQGAGPSQRHRGEPRGARPRRRPRPRAGAEEVARAAARRADPGQGQHRHRRQDGDHCRVAGAGRSETPGRRVLRRAAPQGRGTDPRQDEPERVGLRPQHPDRDQWLERPRRTNEEPLRPRPQPLRFQFRVGVGPGRQPVRRGRRHRDGRIDHGTRVGQRHRRRQADGGAGQPHGDYSHIALV